MSYRALVVTICALWTSTSTAADWPQWRGPNRDGKSADIGLAKSWPKSGPRLLWSSDQAGLGYSAPAIVGNTLYCMGGDDGKDEYVFAFDANTGKQLWRTTTGPWFKNNWGGGPRATPSIDGDSVFAIGARGDIVCINAKKGTITWQKNFTKELNGKLMPPGWGFSESPLVDGNLVICQPGGEDGAIAALDKATGAVKWRCTDVTDDASYSSLVISNAAGVKHYVTLTSKAVVGISPSDGKLLWRVEGEGFAVAVIPTAVVSGDYVFATTDYRAKCMGIKLSKAGGGLKADKLYSSKDMENHHGGVIQIGDDVFGSHGNANNKKTLPFQSFNFKTGKVNGKESLEPSAICWADGQLYCYGQNTGVLVRGTPSPGGFTATARFTIPKESPNRKPAGGIWTHPVIANGKLYLRDQELLFCYDLKEAAGAE